MNPQINNNNNLIDNLLKRELIKKNHVMQNKRFAYGEDTDYPSKTNIIGKFQSNDDVLKLNENKK